jgi:hypothetical protein
LLPIAIRLPYRRETGFVMKLSTLSSA